MNELTTSQEIERRRIEHAEGWREILTQIPTLNFPSEWDVRIVPPYAGALVRFQVVSGDDFISVYLDWYNTLGYQGGNPYWEAYSINGDTERFDLHETKELIQAIQDELLRRSAPKGKMPVPSIGEVD